MREKTLIKTERLVLRELGEGETTSVYAVTRDEYEAGRKNERI